MCGIAGLVHWSCDRDNPAQKLMQMSHAILHRGPDDAGYLFAGNGITIPSDDPKTTVRQEESLGETCLGLAHRRLSILDLEEHGRQPMNQGERAKNKRSPWIVYNGETYNFRELRAELMQSGASFATNTDTEVLLAAYEHWGENFITRCNGMFALALYDPQRNMLLLYRDRVGIKPLYIREDERSLTFASEMKAILAGDDFTRTADPAAMMAYLDFQIVHHRPETFLRGICELPPGHMMTIDLATRKSKTTCYYDLATSLEARRNNLPAKAEDLVAFVKEAFISSIRSHLVSDVPIGSCLSGGLDSSSIVCTADMLMRTESLENSCLGDHITTFSSCHKDKRFDEQEYIDLVVEACSAKSIKVFSSPEDLAERFDKLVWHQDEPFTSASIFAQFLLMEAAHKNGVTVLLDGQGGDEIFAGYRKFFFFYMRDLLRGKKIGRFSREMYGGITRGDGDLFEFRAMRRYLPGALRRNIKTIGNFIHHEALKDAGLRGFQGGASLIDRQILDVERYSLPALLHYEDRNSMAFGIEARVPFLDHQMIETGIALPIEAKINGGISKHILREAMRGIVPERILNRRTKMGFVTPEQQWMRHTLRPLMEEMLAAPQYVTKEIVDIKGVAEQYRFFVNNGQSALAPREFFRLLCLDRWIKLCNVMVV